MRSRSPIRARRRSECRAPPERCRLRELEYALTHSGVSVLIAARRFRSTDYVEMLLGLMPELTSTGAGPIQSQRVPALRRLIYLGTDAGPGGIAWGEFLDLANRVSARDLEARETASRSMSSDTAMTSCNATRPR